MHCNLFVKSRGELGGIESEPFDFSQLEEYINDDNESNIYFHESLVTSSDLKLNEVPEKNHLYVRHLPDKSSVLLAVEGTESRGHIPVGQLCLPPPVVESVHSSPGSQHHHHHHHKAYGVRNGRNNSLDVSSSFTKPHHLPDSPPDSGSEPPFSPPNEGPKLKCPSLDLLHHPHSLPPDLPEGLKHYVNSYKHDISSSTSPTSSSSSPHPLRHQSSIFLGSRDQPSSPVHSASMPVLTPGGQPLMAQIPTMTSYPLQQQLMTSAAPTHLGHLYAGSEEFLYENLANPVSSTTTCKKRKLPESPKTHRSGIHVKLEPSAPSPDPTTTVLPSSEEDYTFELSAAEANALFVDSSFQCIRFQPFQPNTWAQLLDKDMKEIPTPNFRVDADKGFNYSNADESFVCQKKNHFQVTVHIQPLEDARYVRTEEAGTRPIDKFSLHFHGVKMESPTQTIKVEQSQSDRSKRPFHPVPLEMVRDQVTKTTVGRLHFSETTSNNMRKKGKPNPDQRFFFLVVSLCAHSQDSSYTVAAHASEKIIVRASNPGQFENDMELSWQKGQTLDSIFHNGRVGINTDRPEESLVVHGNIKVTGHILQPSDYRAKYDIHELDPREQLRNVSRLRIVRYRYLPEFGDQAGLTKGDAADTGVIAQEVRKVLPEAVREAGDVTLNDGHRIDNMLVVNKDRIFMENVGAVKELCRVTDNLENRIGQLERINRKLTSIKRKDSLKSTSTDISMKSSVSSSMHRCRRSCRQQRARGQIESCSSHFLQSSIVVLVVIMACCLMALATIWVMQWQTHLSHMKGAILIQMKSPPPWNTTASTKERSYILSTLFPSITITSSYEPLSSTKAKSMPGDMHGTTLKHITHKTTSLDEGFDDDECGSLDECPIFCCDEHYADAEEDPDEELLRHHAEKSGSKDAHSDPEQKKTVPANTEDEQPSNKNVGDDQQTSSSNIKKRMIESEDEMGENSQTFRTESDIDLHLLELNVTLIPGVHCMRQLEDTAVVLCAVNISRHFPHPNVTLRIRSEGSDAVIELCGESHYMSCPREALDHDDKSQSTNSVAKREATSQSLSWQLPVSSFIRSRYRFRMMSRRFEAPDQQICSLRGGGYPPFTEYVLTFRRRCDK